MLRSVMLGRRYALLDESYSIRFDQDMIQLKPGVVPNILIGSTQQAANNIRALHQGRDGDWHRI